MCMYRHHCNIDFAKISVLAIFTDPKPITGVTFTIHRYQRRLTNSQLEKRFLFSRNCNETP